jgi:hypothetical protein
MKKLKHPIIFYIIFICLGGLVCNFTLCDSLAQKLTQEFMLLKEQDQNIFYLRSQLDSIYSKKFSVQKKVDRLIIIQYYFNSLNDFRNKIMHFRGGIIRPYDNDQNRMILRKELASIIKEILISKDTYWASFKIKIYQDKVK